MPTDGNPGAAAHISIARASAAALQGTDRRRDGRHLARRSARVRLALARGAVGRARRAAARPLELAALGRERAPRAVARARSPCPRRGRRRRRHRQRGRCCSIRRRSPPGRADPAAARALLRASGAEGTLALDLWAEPGIAGAGRARDRGSTRRRRGTGDRARSRRRPSGPRVRVPGSSGWTPAYGDPAAVFVPARRRAPAEVAGRDREARAACRAPRRRCAPRRVPAARRSSRRRRSRCDSAAARKLFHADLVHAGGERHPPCLRPRPRPALHTAMTAPRHSESTPASLRDGQAVGFHGGRRRGQRRRARRARGAPRASATTAREWRALAEAVVLHVRTTPPSPVPAGLLPALPAKRSRRRGFALRAGGLVAAASAAAVLGVAVAGWHSSPPVQVPVGRRAALRDRRRLEHERHARRSAAAEPEGRSVAACTLTL